MAESILFDVAGSLITKLGCLALEEVGLVWGVNDELEKLKDTVSTIEAVLLDAEEQQSKSNAVKNWVSKLKDAFHDADDLIDEFCYESLRREIMTRDGKKAKQVRIFFSKSNQIAFGLQMGHKLKEFREKLDAIAADKTQFHFSENVRDTHTRERRYTHSFIREEEVMGRDDDRRAIIDHLMDTNIEEDVSIIAIVGIGGLGKTTLAQSVFNNDEITKYFELKLWVCISEEFEVKAIVEKIIESAINKKPEPLEIDLLQSRLRREIDGKKYLLILDDVWNDDYGKWANLKRLLMGGAKGSKIVITTRSEQVAKTCDAHIIYPLECLSGYISWLLFKQMAFKGGDEVENANLIKIGKEIVAKLKGVPLVIRTIGRLLYYKKSEADWLVFKDKELNTVMQEENEMQSILKLSYNHLSSNLKQCFTYCALFPKDYEIQKDELIKQWIAQGFVQSHGLNKPIEDVGEDYFMELSWRSFFQDIKINEWGDIMGCKMHDFMHDLACSIVENECLFVNVNVNVNARPIYKRTRHVLLYCNPIKTFEFPELLFEAKNLRTILLQYYPYYCSKSDYNKPLLNKILSNSLRLRTLKLSISWITKLPKFIGKLKHLRYLDLSHNELMESLPDSITELYNLETLILRKCWRLRELPKDTKNLVNLRHLDLVGCSWMSSSPKGLGGMTNLLTLSLFVLTKDGGDRLSELNGLNNLRGSLTVRGLNYCTPANLLKNTYYLKLKSGLRKLKLKWSSHKDLSRIDDDDERVLECLEPHPNVQEISIEGYRGVRLHWLPSNSLIHLITIKLSSCERLWQLPHFDQFPFLKHLDLDELTSIEYIDNNDSISSSMFFPSLERLWISQMYHLKGWWNWKDETSDSLSTFQFLSQLKIADCRQLTCIPRHPPLQSLDISWGSMQVLDMVIKTTTGEPSSALSKLHTLRLCAIEGFEFLPEELLCNLTALEYLEINDCINFSHFIDKDDDGGVVWKKLGRLHHLTLKNIFELEHLPKGLQHLTTIRYIFISYCENLTTLPEWIGNLTLLASLSISACPKLTSLPEGIRHLTSLSDFQIARCSNLTSLPEGMCHLISLQLLEIFDCPKLVERCKEGTGEDWPKIAHVPYRRISMPSKWK